MSRVAGLIAVDRTLVGIMLTDERGCLTTAPCTMTAVVEQVEVTRGPSINDPGDVVRRFVPGPQRVVVTAPMCRWAADDLRSMRYRELDIVLAEPPVRYHLPHVRIEPDRDHLAGTALPDAGGTVCTAESLHWGDQ